MEVQYMSLEQHALIARENVPSVTAWQAAITQLGFDFQIDPELKPFEDTGFVPCKLGQLDSGFEIYYESVGNVLSSYPQIKEKIEPRDFAISFRYAGDMAECACALIASASLAKSFDAVIYDPQDDLIYSFDDLISEIGLVLAEIENPSQEDIIEQPLAEPPKVGKRWWEFWK